MSDRDALRDVFFTAWRKHLEKLPVEPLEAQIIDIVLQHPEYHDMLRQPEIYQTKEFETENPFLHLSLHLTLREQVTTDRPHGIRKIYETLSKKLSNSLEAEHQMIECLAKILWAAQRHHKMPDEEEYLSALQTLI